MLDNYDSFTYNLVQLLGELGSEVKVFRNDDLSVKQAMELKPQALVISPGPGRPENAGISVELVGAAIPKIPLLGVCLGHQALGYAFGARVIRAETLMHGKTSAIHHKGTGLYAGVPSPFPATRYHSLVLERESLPECLEVTAWTDDNTIMGVRHRDYSAEGVQFHPESILTEQGKEILSNFLAGIA